MLFGAINIAMFDWPWSGIHFLSGLVAGLVLSAVSFLHPRRSSSLSPIRLEVHGRGVGVEDQFWTAGLTVLILWELTEITLRYLDGHAHQAIRPLKDAVGGFAFAPETHLNTLGDLVIGSIGLWLGRWVMSRRSVR